MKTLLPVSGSFRDPSGHVCMDESGNIYRTVHLKAKENFDAVEASGAYRRLVDDGMLIRHEMHKGSTPLGENIAYLLEHPTIPFISFPYEWSFEQLRAAALLHLKAHMVALDYEVTLSDATAYNIQFIGNAPVFIDTLSFIPYREGMLWSGHRQFVEQFVTPLLLWTYCGVTPHDWYRGSLKGIDCAALNKLLPLRRKLSLAYCTHVYLPQLFESRRYGEGKGKPAAQRPLPKEGLLFMLRQLKAWLERLPAPRRQGYWHDYTSYRSYSAEELGAKGEFVRQAVQAAKPAQLWDIGCNTGEYSALALDAGASYVVGFESDVGALELAVKRATEEKLAYLPVHMNLCSPSPSSGWAQQERPGLLERRNATFILALAVLHHIVIGNNVPLVQALHFLLSLADEGIIEWVPKSDVMVQGMLRHREDIFDDYTRENFLSCIGEHAAILHQKELTAGGRLLVHYRKRTSC